MSSSNTPKSQSVIEVGDLDISNNPDFTNNINKSISEQNQNMTIDSKPNSITKFSDPSLKFERKWEYFPGKNKFYFDGRLMTAPSIRFCMLSFILILVTFVLFTAFDGPFLADRLTPVIPVIGSILFFLVIVNMLKTSCSDPGILPRASIQESEYIEKSYANPNGLRPPPRTRDIIVNGQTIKSKYCFTCKMFRPPRASHCGVCDNCVDRFDHHCPFLGNCIGKRNYRNFYTFIVSLSLLAVFVLSCSITKLALLGKDKGNFLEALRESPTSAIVILISFLGMWTVIGLAGFHTYLIAVEQTTNEDIKGMFGRANSVNPYTRGNFCRNCCFILCGPHQPSLIDSRGIVTSEFLASLPKKGSGDSENISTAPCGLPPPTIRPHCSEGSNTPRGQEQFQMSIESGGHKSKSHASKVISPTSNTSPVVINTRSVSSIPKANTVPGESNILMTQSNRHSIEGLQTSVPIYTSSKRPSYHLSDSIYSPTRQEQSCELGSLSSPTSKFGMTNQNTVDQHHHHHHYDQQHQDMSLDFPSDYNSSTAAHQSNHQKSTSGISTSAAPLIPTTTTTSNKQTQHIQQMQQQPHGRMYTNSNKDFNEMNGLSSATHAPVALSFYEDDDPTNDLTMINSPLDLDQF